MTLTTAQFITVRETSQLLGITEKKVMEMVETEELQAYKIAGQFLRLKRSDVMTLKNKGNIVNEAIQYPYTTSERVRDFFYYNDFYIISCIIILALVYIIFQV